LLRAGHCDRFHSRVAALWLDGLVSSTILSKLWQI
jgi:hypothetical protein